MDIAIIGAGATGMSAAFDLSAAGHRVVIIEALDQPGGLACGFKQPNWDWSVEKYYHHWFASDVDLLRLADEMGVRAKVGFTQPKTVSYWNGAFYPLDSPAAALRFPGLSLPAKIPFGLATIYLRSLKNGLALEKFTAYDWAKRWMGRAAFEKIWEPLLSGKFGDEYGRQVNMAWLWARIASRTPKLGTYEGGFQAFFDALADVLKKRGVEFRFKMRAERLRWIADKQKWRIELSQPFTIMPPLNVDRVLVTTSPKLLTQLAPDLPAEYLGSLRDLKSLGAVVTTLELDRPLSPQKYYWHSLPKNEGFPFLALCEHTNFIPRRHFGGSTIVYCGDYLDPAGANFALSNAELENRYIASLTRFNPAFDRSWIKGAWTHRDAYAQPVPFVNHSRNIPPTRTPAPGLFYAGMSHVYPWDRGTNYAVRLGREVAGQIRGEGRGEK